MQAELLRGGQPDQDLLTATDDGGLGFDHPAAQRGQLSQRGRVQRRQGELTQRLAGSQGHLRLMCSQQGAGGYVLWAGQHPAGFHALDQAAVVQYRHMGGGAADHFHLVGHDDEGQVTLLLNTGQQVEDAGAGFGVQGAGGFVGQQQFRVRDQGAGNAHPLFLPARQLGRVTVPESFQPHLCQPLAGQGLAACPRHSGEFQGQGHVLHGGALGEQVEVLEHQSGAGLALAALGWGQGQQVFAAQVQLAAVGRIQAAQQPDQGAFAGAAAPDDACAAATRHAEGEVFQRRVGAEPFGDAAQFQRRAGLGRSCRGRAGGEGGRYGHGIPLRE